jgi:serine/threonine-protein kinase
MDAGDPTREHGGPASGPLDGATRAATPQAAMRAAASSPEAADAPHAPTQYVASHASPAAPVAPLPDGDSDPLLGTIVAERYRLLERLGAGGMGAVYRGEHVTLKKRVAVKFLHRELGSNKELVSRFEREAVAAANLEHPNVVAATDFARLPDGTFFLVMEFVDGRSLRKLLEESGRLPPGRAFHILRQIAAALGRAHALGIVHRDLKPENVVVADREGERDFVKVIDFGIARVSGSAFGAGGTALTQLGTIFGTPEYMAPEQAMGQPVDARADQYALGIMAFELFTGRRPFHAEDAIDLLRMHVGAPMPAATSFAPDLPPALDAVLLRMGAKRPAERFDSVASAMAAMEAALGAVVAASAPTARLPPAQAGVVAAPSVHWHAPTSTTTAPAPGRRTGLVIGGGLAALFVLALILGLATAPSRAPATTAPGAVTTAQAAGGDPATVAVRLASYPRDPEVAQALARSWRGDADGAARILQARRNQNPNDGLAAYFLGTVYWTARRHAQAVQEYGAAVSLEPGLASDPTLARAVAGALADPAAAQRAEDLLRTGPLSQSAQAAAAVAEVAIGGSHPGARARALALAREMAPLLRSLDAARVRLRAATDCSELQAALAALEALGPGVAQDEVRAVHEGECEMLQMRDECRACLEGEERHRRRR